MSNQPPEADWLQAVGHPYRVEIMRRYLATGTATPSDVAEMLRLPLGTVSYHVRFLARCGILRLAGRTQRRGASVHHYLLADRERVAAVLWGMRAALLVTDSEREHGRADRTAALDAAALIELRALTAAYLTRIGELALQTRERASIDGESPAPVLTQVAVLLATDEGAMPISPAWR